MANRIQSTRYGQIPGGAPFKETLVFKEYQPDVDRPQIAHTPPGQTGLWVFESYGNAMFDVRVYVEGFTVVDPEFGQYLDIPDGDNYWRPLGTADGAVLPLPIRSGWTQITKEAYDLYVAENSENGPAVGGGAPVKAAAKKRAKPAA